MRWNPNDAMAVIAPVIAYLLPIVVIKLVFTVTRTPSQPIVVVSAIKSQVTVCPHWKINLLKNPVIWCRNRLNMATVTLHSWRLIGIIIITLHRTGLAKILSLSDNLWFVFNIKSHWTCSANLLNKFYVQDAYVRKASTLNRYSL